MFERFTDKARTAVIVARAEASERGDQIRPVYLLHALAACEGVAARALAGLGVDAVAIERRLGSAAPLRRPPAATTPRRWPASASTWTRSRARSRRASAPARSTGRRAVQGTGRLTMTREAKQSVELAAKEARALRHGYVGTEHLLLGLIGAAQRNPRGDFSPQTLRDLGIDPAAARQRVTGWSSWPARWAASRTDAGASGRHDALEAEFMVRWRGFRRHQPRAAGRQGRWRAGAANSRPELTK